MDFLCKIGLHKWYKVRDGVRECKRLLCPVKRQVFKNKGWVKDKQVITGFISNEMEAWYSWQSDIDLEKEGRIQ